MYFSWIKSWIHVFPYTLHKHSHIGISPFFYCKRRTRCTTERPISTELIPFPPRTAPEQPPWRHLERKTPVSVMKRKPVNMNIELKRFQKLNNAPIEQMLEWHQICKCTETRWANTMYLLKKRIIALKNKN